MATEQQILREIKEARAETAELREQLGEIVRAILAFGVYEAKIAAELAHIRARTEALAQAADDRADAVYDAELAGFMPPARATRREPE